MLEEGAIEGRTPSKVKLKSWRVLGDSGLQLCVCLLGLPNTTDGGLDHRDGLSHSSGSWKSEVTCRKFLPWLVEAASSLCLHMVFPRYQSVSSFPIVRRTPVMLVRRRLHTNDLI